MCVQGQNFEKRNVKVGVSDYFFAEIQEGLKAGETVALELPKEERDKMTRQMAGLRPGGEGAVPAPRPAISSTNTPKAAAVPASAETVAKTAPAASPSVVRGPVSTTTAH